MAQCDSVTTFCATLMMSEKQMWTTTLSYQREVELKHCSIKTMEEKNLAAIFPAKLSKARTAMLNSQSRILEGP